MLMHVVVVVMEIMTGRGLMAVVMRVAHISRMAGKPCCSTSTTALWTHLRPSCWV